MPALRRAPGARSLSAVFGRHDGLRTGVAQGPWPWHGSGQRNAATPGSPGCVLESPRIVVRCEHRVRLWAGALILIKDVEHGSPGDAGSAVSSGLGHERSTRWQSQDDHRLLPNKRMKLTSALASAPRDTEAGHSACPPFGGHRTLAAYPRCWADPLLVCR